MSWGKWIILSFVMFGVFIILLVGVCMRQNVDLVSKTYYSDELVYQEQIQRIANTSKLSAVPEMNVRDNTLEVHFSKEDRPNKGNIRLFRPSDEDLDQSFKFASVNDSVLQYQLKPLVKGLYRVQMTWTMQDKEYYIERIINI